MNDKQKIVMTGATSGLGKISAIKAASQGSLVIVIARNLTKGENLKKEFITQFPKSKGEIHIIEGDLSSLKSVEDACNDILLKYSSINMIVNNAGIMNFEHKKTVDNIEETLQVNLISPLLICHLLFPILQKSSTSKIIFTSSGLHQGNINFENIEFIDSFSSFKVYRQSKLGVILICRLLSNQLKADNINIYSQHPGMVRTELGRSAGWFSKLIFYIMGKSPKKGAETLNFLIETPNNLLKSGEYYSNKKITKTTKESYDLKVAEKLIETTKGYLVNYLKNETPIFKNN